MTESRGIAALSAGLCWRASEAVLVVWAYYDESGEYDAAGKLQRMTIGGCIAPNGNWQRFEPAWRKALAVEGLESFHMTDFEAWRPPFDFKLPDGKRDHERHRRLLGALLDAMLENVEGLYGFSSFSACADDAPAHRLFMEEAVFGAVSHAVNDAWNLYQQPINLVFASQQHFPQSGIKKALWLYDFGDGAGRIKGQSAYPAAEIPALQAADVLAYEMARAQRHDRPERYPFTRMREAAASGKVAMTLKWGPIRSDRDSVLAGQLS